MFQVGFYSPVHLIVLTQLVGKLRVGIEMLRTAGNRLVCTEYERLCIGTATVITVCYCRRIGESAIDNGVELQGVQLRIPLQNRILVFVVGLFVLVVGVVDRQFQHRNRVQVPRQFRIEIVENMRRILV